MLSPSGHLLSRHHNDLKKIFSLSDIVIMNREEAILATNAPTDDPKKVFKVLDAMVPRIAIMTSGDSGSYASDGVHLFYAPAFRVRLLMIKRSGRRVWEWLFSWIVIIGTASYIRNTF
jgi:sugar/nucleoside kinase (ribokinase family)